MQDIQQTFQTVKQFANISIKDTKLNGQEIITLATQQQACH
jgi:hypothetical protein